VVDLKSEKELNNVAYRLQTLSSRHVSNIAINIEDLIFRYPENNDWSLNIPKLEIFKGERIAIVGPSGSGKSSLLDVILGLQSFPSGKVEIYVGGSGGLCYVPQKISLLNRSISENVALGIPKSDIDIERVREALATTGMLSVVESFPLGIETAVGERGVFLSGGQIQRIALSRAFYSQPEILFLDEATSALDSASEQDVTLALEKLPSDVTIVVIAHRLSTVRNMSRTLYMESGEIRGEGTFDELRKRIPEFNHQAELMGL
jgi:ABC-type bacteriocin/lantibiotic exporter with double-glycine peptidase domain